MPEGTPKKTRMVNGKKYLLDTSYSSGTSSKRAAQERAMRIEASHQRHSIVIDAYDKYWVYYKA